MDTDRPDMIAQGDQAEKDAEILARVFASFHRALGEMDEGVQAELTLMYARKVLMVQPNQPS